MEPWFQKYETIGITNRQLCEGDFFSQIERIGDCGIQGLILREKDLNEQEYEQVAKTFLAICEQKNVKGILHTYIETAKKLCCERIHLPLPVLKNAGDLSTFSCIGCSIHSVQEAILAQELGATYLLAGHIYETDCKKGVPGRGLAFLEEVVQQVDVPVYGLGGIHKENANRVLEHKAKGIAIMSEVMNF